MDELRQLLRAPGHFAPLALAKTLVAMDAAGEKLAKLVQELCEARSMYPEPGPS